MIYLLSSVLKQRNDIIHQYVVVNLKIMQLTFIFIGIIGILLLIFSIRILIKSSKNKLVAEFTLDSESKEIQLNSTGLYSLCFLGAGFVDNRGKFDAELKAENGNLIKLNKTFPNYRFRKNEAYSKSRAS